MTNRAKHNKRINVFIKPRELILFRDSKLFKFFFYSFLLFQRKETETERLCLPMDTQIKVVKFEVLLVLSFNRFFCS